MQVMMQRQSMLGLKASKPSRNVTAQATRSTKAKPKVTKQASDEDQLWLPNTERPEW